MTTTYETVLVHREGPVARLTINRPDKLNAINGQVVDDLSAALAALVADGGVRAVELTGAGDKAFVAGADIAAMAEMGPAEAEAFARKGHALGAQMAAAPFPIVAVVNGFALGGGTELALACDLIVASDRAKFGQPEVGLGVIPGFGGTVRLGRRVGLGKARELILTGQIIDAAEAHRIGLADRVVPHAELAAQAAALSATLAAQAPRAVALAKQVLYAGEGVPEAVAASLEVQAFALCFSTEDQKTGMRTFVASPRNPRVFQGR